MSTAQTSVVVTDYTGGCRWADDLDLDGSLEAAIVAARVRLATGFEACKK